jgi:dynein heavy chain
MKKTSVAPNVLYIVIKEGVTEVLAQANRNIEVILKGLENYLEMKRLAFPRFYFLSNDELLNILAHIREPAAVQPYLSKCFESILNLQIVISFLHCVIH